MSSGLKVTVITLRGASYSAESRGFRQTTAEPESAFSQVPQVIFRHFKVGEALA